MATYTKLFSSITDSSIWCEDNETRLVWVTMLAMADKHGHVIASLPGLAHRARVPLEAAERAVRKFCEPDCHSQSRESEGRRVRVIDRGWALINHAKFRNLRSEDDRRAQNRESARKYRERKAARSASSARQQTSAKSAGVSQESAQADTDTSPDTSQNHERETRAHASGLESLVRVEFSRRFAEAEGTLWTLAGDPAVAQVAAWLATAPGSPTEALGRLLDAFFGDAWCRSQHFPVRHLARYPQKYFEPRDAPGPAKTLEQQIELAQSEMRVHRDAGRMDEADAARERLSRLRRERDSQEAKHARR